MTIIEKAKEIRNWYNRYSNATLMAAMELEKLEKMDKEFEKAQSKIWGKKDDPNLIVHFKTVGAWLDKDGACKQRKYIEELYQHQWERAKNAVAMLEHLITEKENRAE